MTRKKEQYQIFDTKEDTSPSTLVLTSNKNIRKACRVWAGCSLKTREERLYYAEIGEIPPDKFEEIDGEMKAVYEESMKGVYNSEGIFWAGLAEKIFYECPDLLYFDEEHDEYRVKEDCQELFEGLIRSEVQRGWADFLASWNGKLYEEAMLQGYLPSDLDTSLQMQEIGAKLMEAIGMTTSEKQPHGETESSASTERGK